MDYKEVQELIKTINDSNIYSIEIDNDGTHIKMSKGPEQVILSGTATSVEAVSQTKVMPEEVVKLETQTKVSKKHIEEEGLYTVKSPIVGTFYASASPEKADYVSVGTKVAKGSILCILEAMKLMNEIKSEVDGEIVEVLVRTDDMVEYGQALFKIRESGK
jgi:acetyl-CoA carboxylase biotin carboxyl carrier protein